MSIRAFTGLPGSGKSYRVVYELVKKGHGERAFVVHNVDGLKDVTVSGDGFCRSVADVQAGLGVEGQDFWTKGVQEKLTGEVLAKYKRPVLLVCDEAQTLFGKRALTQERLDWLTYHRHLGQDVWLVSQTMELLHRDVQDLVEVEIRARRGLVTSSYIYQWRCGGQGFKFDRIAKDQAIFAAYSSARLHGAGGAKSYLVWLALGGFLAAGVGVKAYASRLGSDHRAAVVAESSVTGEGPQPGTEAATIGTSGGLGAESPVSRGKGSSKSSGEAVWKGPVKGRSVELSQSKLVTGEDNGAKAKGGRATVEEAMARYSPSAYLRGRVMVEAGGEDVLLEEVCDLGEWVVFGVDEPTRSLVMVHPQKGVKHWPSSTRAWVVAL